MSVSKPAGLKAVSLDAAGTLLFPREPVAATYAAFARRHGPVALAGFFCDGEIGPVGGRTFLHGYTSAFGLFRPRAPRA